MGPAWTKSRYNRVCKLSGKIKWDWVGGNVWLIEPIVLESVLNTVNINHKQNPCEIKSFISHMML